MDDAGTASLGPGARIAVHAALVLIALVTLFPFYWMIIASTHPTSQILVYPPNLLPGSHLIGNLRDLFDTVPAARAFGNSLLIATSQTLLVLFFCSLGGFAFAKYTFPGRDRLFLLVLATMMIPQVVSLVPWYIMMSKFGWVNTYRALIIPGAASAFGIFWMRQYIAGAVPDEMLQAARIDGAGHFGLYWRFVLPLIRPGLGTLGILTFLTSWNDFLAPLIILKDPAKYTLTVILAVLQNQYGTNLGIMMTGAALSTFPILAIFVVMSRQFIGGLSAGAVKA